MIDYASMLLLWHQGQNTDSDAALAGGTTLQGSVNTILRVNEDGTDRNLGMLLADRIHSLPVTLPHLDFAYLKVQFDLYYYEVIVIYTFTIMYPFCSTFLIFVLIFY